MDLCLNYGPERVGPMTVLGIMLADEESACRKAMEILGTETTPIATDSYDWGWEVRFETAHV